MEKVSLPTGLLSFTVGAYFNQSIEKVSLFTGLLSLTVGAYLTRQRRQPIQQLTQQAVHKLASTSFGNYDAT